MQILANIFVNKTNKNTFKRNALEIMHENRILQDELL